MSVSIKSPTSTTGSIQLNGSDVLTIESDNSVDIDSGTLHVDATNNRVGVGTSSPTQNLQIYNNGATSGQIHITNTSTGATASDGVLFGYDGSNDVIINNQEATTTKFYTNAAERMRIDSSGNVLIGQSSTTIPGAGNTTVGISLRNGGLGIFSSRDSGATAHFNRNSDGPNVELWRSGSLVGSISVTTSATAYNTSSDYRLKEDWQPMSGSIDRLKSLNPVNFAWKVDGSRVDGFLAHEAQTVVPEAVTGEKDAMRTEEYEVTPAVLDDDGNVVTEAVMETREVPDYQGIDQSKLVPLLTSALQEAITKIEDLETRIQALESANV